VHGAKSQLSRLVEAACCGEEVIICRDGVPVVKLVPITQPKAKRILGQARGLVQVSPDFDQPMSDAELDEFLGR
jgi:antitoxin (DNA-binding transcriptional repressor) of toxin-antitoxin stability system